MDRGDPITFELGRNRVIKGWDQGLVGTCPGQKLKLEIPSELAYGAKGAGEVIPPNSDLVFEVTLVSLKSKRVKIDVLNGGPCSSDQKTRDNDVVKFNYIGYLEDGNFETHLLRFIELQFQTQSNFKTFSGKKFDSTNDEGREPLENTIGKIGIKGWDDALKGACPEETRMVFIPYELAYGEEGVEGFVPPKSNLVLQIEFLNVRSRVLNFLDRISSGGFTG